jgi:phage terminase small subunit
MNTTKLRYQTFASEYATNGFNAKQAAIAAGYSPKTAEVQGSKLLRNPKVIDLVNALVRPILDKYEITVEKTLEHLAALAYADMRDLGRWGVRDGVPYYLPSDSDDLDERVSRSIASVKMKAKYRPARENEEGFLVSQEYYDVEVEVKQHDKLGALNTLAKYQGLLPTSGKVRINVDDRQQTANVFSGLSREEILEIARLPLDGEMSSGN